MLSEDTIKKEICDPSEITEDVDINTTNLLSARSKKKYELTYQAFMDWRSTKGVSSFSENDLLAYFKELSGKYKSSSLWTTYSMLRSTLNTRHNENIEKYPTLRAFLKSTSEGYNAKKAKTFTPDEIKKFINQASDQKYLATKVALIMGVTGACRSKELYLMKLEDVEDLGSGLLVTIRHKKPNIDRIFTVTGYFYEICKKYMDVRSNIVSPEFFLNCQKGKFTPQRIGLNKFCTMGKDIAKFLNLPKAHLYSGHSFRRSSATWLADVQQDDSTLQCYDGWNHTPGCAPRGYFDESIKNITNPSNINLGLVKIEPTTSKICNSNDNFINKETQPKTINFVNCSNVNLILQVNYNNK